MPAPKQADHTSILLSALSMRSLTLYVRYHALIPHGSAAPYPCTYTQMMAAIMRPLTQVLYVLIHLPFVRINLNVVKFIQ